MEETAIGGLKYFLIFVDDYTRCVWVRGMARKDQTLESYKEWEGMLKQKGTFHYTSIPYSPQQNGIAERKIRILCDGARAMLHAAGLPKRFWFYAVQTMAYLSCRSPTKANDGTTPYELWYKKAPILSHLRMFGCPVSIAILSHERKKFDSRSHLCYFVGYVPFTSGYRVWDPVSRKEIRTHDVVFHEDLMPSFAIPKEEEIKTEENVSALDATDGPSNTKVETDEKQRLTIHIPGRLPPRPAEQPMEVNTPEPPNVPENTPEQDVPTAVHDVGRVHNFPEYTTRSGRQRALQSSEIARMSVENPVVDFAFSAALGRPMKLVDAMALPGGEGQAWRKAAQREWQNLAEHDVYHWVNPEKEKVITCGTVLKQKMVNGKVTQYKVRAVVHGYRQIAGLHYNETHAPVMRLESLRIMLSVGAIKDAAIRQFDVKSAYLHGKMKERVLVHPPEGFPIPKGKEGMVWELDKALYGTKQGGTEWHEEISKTMIEDLGWQRSPRDDSVFTKTWENGDWAAVGFWVDDETGVGTEERLIELERYIDEKYGVSSSGPVSWILGMTVERDMEEHVVKLGQEAYIDSLLTRFGLGEAKPVSTPLPVGANITKADCPTTQEEMADMATVPYRELVGSLMYAMLTTHPEIAYAVSVLSKFMGNPGRVHFDAAKRVLRYLKGVKGAKLVLGGRAELRAYSDADWAGDKDDRRSTGGYVFCIGKGAVSWSAKRQPTVALSSLEAEYMALTQATKEAVWIQRFLADIGINIRNVKLFGDNQGSLALSKNSVYHGRTKHIDIQHHYIRETIAMGHITVEYLPTEYMVADIMTKSLATEKHRAHTRALGVEM